MRNRALLPLLLVLGLACAAPAPSAAPAKPTSQSPAAPAPAAAAAPTAPPPAASAAPATASAAAGLPPAPNRPVEKVTIGVLGTTADVIFYLAEELGAFERMRIEPAYERFDSGGRMVASLATGQIDLGGGSASVGLYNAIARGVNVKLVADRASSAPGHNITFVWARKDLVDSGQLRDYADLRGKRIAVAAKGTNPHAVAGKTLERGGLSFADAELIEMSYPDMIVAMGTGSIDVAVSPEPFPAVAEQRGVAVKWRFGQDIEPGQAGSLIMYAGSFAEQRAAVARDFMVAYLVGARAYHDAFIKRDPDAYARAEKLVLERTEIRDRALLEQVEFGYVNPNGTFDRTTLLENMHWFQRNAGLTETVDLDTLVDDQYTTHAVGVLGAYR